MSKHKKQHYIPRAYLSAWCDKNTPSEQEPYVWQFKKDRSDIVKKSPKNIFTENEIYTIEGLEGNRDLVLEHGLKQLEDQFSKIRKNKINKNKSIDISEKIYLCAFLAAMRARTKANRDHQQKEWRKIVDHGNKIMKAYNNLTDEQKEGYQGFSSLASKERDSISFEEAQELSEKPLQKLLFTEIKVTTPNLLKMNMSVLTTDEELGFITSDNPCVWEDPDGYKRHPYYRSPGFQNKSLEITLPISPNALVLLTYLPLKTYISVNSNKVKEFNRRTRFHAYEYFIVNQNSTDDYWFWIGEEPEDSWEKKNKNK